jgi:hypothetical protein
VSDPDVLLAAVYANPRDDAPRAALARQLANTPRGELLALQLGMAGHAPPSRAEKSRVRALLAAHADEWLAPLGGALVKRSVRWARGFPVAGQLAAQRTPERAVAVIGLPALATLEQLELELPNLLRPEEYVERFVFESPLRGLRVLRGFPRALLPRMLGAQPAFAIEELSVALEGGGGSSGERAERGLVEVMRTAFRDAVGLPRLRALSLSFSHGISGDPQSYAWLWESDTGRGVKRLSINVGAYAIGAWRDALAAHPTGLESVELFGRNRLVLARSDGGWDRLSVTPSPALFPPEVTQLEATLAELRAAGVVVTRDERDPDRV